MERSIALSLLKFFASLSRVGESMCYVYSEWYYRLSWPHQVSTMDEAANCESTDKFGTKIYFFDGRRKRIGTGSKYVCIFFIPSFFNFPHFGEKFEERIRHFLHSVSPMMLLN